MQILQGLEARFLDLHILEELEAGGWKLEAGSEPRKRGRQICGRAREEINAEGAEKKMRDETSRRGCARGKRSGQGVATCMGHVGTWVSRLQEEITEEYSNGCEKVRGNGGKEGPVLDSGTERFLVPRNHPGRVRRAPQKHAERTMRAALRMTPTESRCPVDCVLSRLKAHVERAFR